MPGSVEKTRQPFPNHPEEDSLTIRFDTKMARESAVVVLVTVVKVVGCRSSGSAMQCTLVDRCRSVRCVTQSALGNLQGLDRTVVNVRTPCLDVFRGEDEIPSADPPGRY